MSMRIEHVRFMLSDLVNAVQARLGVSARPSTQEALTWYWNWATSRGWRMVAVANQITPDYWHTVIERNPQSEFTADERWNVIWSADDATDGGPNLVESSDTVTAVFRQKAVIEELIDRGWREFVDQSMCCDCLGCDGYLPITVASIADCAANVGLVPSLIADELERNYKIE